MMSTGSQAHCFLGRSVPVLAAESSGVGECPGGVMEVQTKMGARFDKVRRPGQRAHAQQRCWRTAELVDDTSQTYLQFLIVPCYYIIYSGCFICCFIWFLGLTY